MAGGNFDLNLGKKRPGTYVNVKSTRQQKIQGSKRGTVIVPLINYDWGPDKEFIKLSADSPDAEIVKLGRSIYDNNDSVLLIREILKNATTCYAYVINNGKAATATTENGITITSVFGGKRGNDITVSCVADTDGGFHVTVHLGAEIVEEYKKLETVKDLISASEQKYVKFSASSNSDETTLQPFAGITLENGSDGTVENSRVAEFLDKSEGIKWNTMCFPVSESSLKAACVAKINHLRSNVGKWVQAVIPDSNTDDEGIINVTNGVILNDGTVIDSVKATAWVAGATAGASKTESNTHKEYDDAAEVYGVKTSEEAVQAIENGEFFFSVSDESKVVVEYDINSLHVFTPEKSQDYSKNRVIRVYDSFSEDLAITFPPNKYDNDTDGWLVMEGIGRALLKSYGPEAEGGDGSIQNVDLDNDFYIDQSKSAGDETYFCVGIQPVDSAEKLYFSVSTR